jgi:hypothetical protein
MKIKPLEKKEDRQIKIRLLFLFFLILSALLFSFFVKNKPPKENKKTFPRQEVLGEKTENPKIDLPDLEKEFKQYKNQLTKEMNRLFEQTASKSNEIISSFVYDTAIKPLINQIQKLPKNQQEKVREEICK